MKLQSFADAAWPRFADEEIRNSHVIVDLLSEAFGKDREASFGFQTSEFCQQLLVLSADQNQLQIAFAAIQAFNNVDHGARSMSAKKHDSGRKVGIER